MSSSSRVPHAPVLPPIGQHFCSNVQRMHAERAAARPMQKRYDDAVALMSTTKDARVRAQIARQIVLLRRERDKMRARHAQAMRAALPHVGEYFDSLARTAEGAQPSAAPVVARAVQQYWSAQPGAPIVSPAELLIDVVTCSVCGRGEMVALEDEGVLQCNDADCAQFTPHVVDNPAHAEVQSEVSYTAYVRLSHFKEILAQLEAKNTHAVPAEVLEEIAARMRVERIRPEDLDYATMRALLVRLKRSKQFGLINHINAHFGIKPPVVNTELREALYRIFDEIQVPWSLHCPPNRANFFNYNYVIYQILKLLGQHDFLKFTSFEIDREIRNNRTKQLEQDERWQRVCAHLGWVFYPTV